MADGGAETATAREIAAMRRALELAALGPFGPNPRVGCVLLADDGEIVAEGHHPGAGTPHAEVDALAEPSVISAGRWDGPTVQPAASIAAATTVRPVTRMVVGVEGTRRRRGRVTWRRGTWAASHDDRVLTVSGSGTE